MKRIILMVFVLCVGAATSTFSLPGDGSVEKMLELMETGLEKLDQGLIADGIKQLVGVLAEADGAESLSGEAREVAQMAETELAKLEAAIAMEADTEWLDAGMNQKTASTLDLTLTPTVRLTIRTGSGRSIMSNAPVEFRFLEGSGILAGIVQTNEFGQAGSAIASLDNPLEENVIRASLVYRVRGFEYRFRNVYRDFIYTPPSRRAVILVLERSPKGIAADPIILDPVLSELGKLDYDFSLHSGSLSPAAFMDLYAGSMDGVPELGLDSGVPYLVMVLNDCFSVRQLEMSGRKLNLFVSEARSTTRIVRVADGKIMYQKTAESLKSRGTHGQGGSEEKAVLDAIQRTSAAMAEGLAASFSEIKRAMSGSEE